MEGHLGVKYGRRQDQFECAVGAIVVQWGGHQARFGGAVGHGWLVQRDWGYDGDGVQCLLASETGASSPQHCWAPRRPLPSAPLRSDLRQMLVTKSVENIQFLPFLTTDAKYSGVRPWGGESHTFEGQGEFPRLQPSACAMSLQQPELVGLWLPEGGWDSGHRQCHWSSSADPLHPGVSLLQPREGGAGAWGDGEVGRRSP